MIKFILFVHPDAGREGKVLHQTVEQYFTGTEILVSAAIESLAETVERECDPAGTIYIVLADSKSRLRDLSEISNLMEGKRLVLILPDDSKNTLSDSMRFFPRYVCCMGSSYHQLCDVLVKMTQNQPGIPAEI